MKLFVPRLARLTSSTAISVLVFALMLSGCSAYRAGEPQDVVPEEPGIERASTAIYNYLLGELSLNQDQPDDALKHFAVSSELLNDPAPSLQVKLTDLYLRQGDLANALRESERAIAAGENDLDLLLIHGGLLEAAGRDGEAAQLYETAIKANPRARIETYLYLSALRVRENNKPGQLAVLKGFVEHFPSEPISHNALGRAYEDAAQYAQAEQELRAAVKLGPDRAGLSFDLIRVLLKRNKIEQAQQIASSLAKSERDNPLAAQIAIALSTKSAALREVQHLLQAEISSERDLLEVRYGVALLNIERQRLLPAIRDLSIVVTKKPDFGQARFYLASVLAGVGRKREAVRELRKISRDQKVFVKSRTLAAFVLRQEGDLRGAEAAVREALEAEPDERQLISYLAIILQEGGRYAQAAELLEEALKRWPEDDRLMFSYGMVLHQEGDEARAIEVMEQVITRTPEHAEALNYVAFSLVESNRELDKALQYVERALKLQPHNGYFLDTLGWLHFQRGNFSEAVTVLAEATQFAGDDVEIAEHYGDALERCGKLAEALKAYRGAYDRAQGSEDKEDQRAFERLMKKISHLDGMLNPGAGKTASR